MPAPVIGSCGGVGERPCPPVTAIAFTPTMEDLHEYGQECFEAGKRSRDEEFATLSANDLECSQQLMALRTERDALQHRLDERDRVAESIPPGTFTVNKPA